MLLARTVRTDTRSTRPGGQNEGRCIIAVCESRLNFRESERIAIPGTRKDTLPSILLEYLRKPTAVP
jgi:hypothetical protein